VREIWKTPAIKERTRLAWNILITRHGLVVTRCSESLLARWEIETVFQEVEAHLNSEIDTLGYPKAALFSFCVAVIAYNMLALIKAALRKVHGEKKITNEVSGYYIAGEINRTHEGMIIALEPPRARMTCYTYPCQFSE
jgi:hypothetical protein